MHSQDHENLLTELVELLEELHEGVCITDGDGVIIRIGKSCAGLYGIDASYKGRHVSALEEEGTFAPSLTLVALRERKKVTMMQPDRFGHELLVTAVPVFEPDTKAITMVISYASWDSTNIQELHKHYHLLQKQITRQNLELGTLKKNMLSSDIVAHSPKMRQIKRMAHHLANMDEAVLITGEAGTGKSTLAKYIHGSSPRVGQPFFQLSCGAFSGDILQDELFGYVKHNSQTGEEVEKFGLCEVADTGTLLLEDVENIGWEVQGVLLHLLKNKCYYKRGAKETKHVDLRVIATSCKSAAELSECLRKEFFYLLSIVAVTMPSLKERREDIPYVIRDFLALFNEKYHKKTHISDESMRLLELYHWPGNITELKYIIQQLVLTGEVDVVRPFHLPDSISPFASARYAASIDLREYMDYCEGRLVLQAYEKCKTTVNLAKYLGISQASAVRKLQKYKPRESSLFRNA